MSRRSNNIGLGTLGLCTSPTSPTYLIAILLPSVSLFSIHLSLPPSIHLPSPGAPRSMPVFSKFAPSNEFSDEDELDGQHSGSEDILSSPPPLKKNSGLASRASGLSGLSASALVDGSRRRHPNTLSRRSVSSRHSHKQPRHASEASNGLHLKSPISISSTDPDELLDLQNRFLELKIENGQLRGEIKGLK
jgi:hypothetical protein